MVDSMRFDLGSLVKTALQRALEGRATLTEETLLWSALPSTTTRQLEGLARGLDSLRTPPALEREGDALRGRTAEIVRRIRAGSRDLFKLDIVESRLREAPNKAISSLPDIALATATVLARHCDHLPPRTLLVVFGDHGFTTDEHGNAVHGGASPEEVLVPAYMFLMGEVH
jgi:hypothetical protein